MQVTETQAEGLKRQFNIVVPAKDLQTKLNQKLSDLAKTAKLPGFRPGKVPVSLMKKRYGQSALGEVIQETVNEATLQAVNDRGLKPALQPKVEILKFEEGQDLEYKVDVEILPEVEPKGIADLAFERPVIKVTDEQVQETLERLAKSRKSFKPLDAERAAASGDLVIIDFAGTVDGEARPGMEGKDQRLELGAGAFIPGFEEQLVGAKKGDLRDVKVTFPAEYPVEDLRSKEALFKVTVKDIQQVVTVALDDELAKSVGMENLDQMRNRVRDQIVNEHANMVRAFMKRKVLDALAAGHDFAVPPGMVEAEFAGIWQQIEADKNAGRLDAEDQGKSDEQLKKEYMAIAERRVRLGLLLSEIGRRAAIDVGQEELTRALMREAGRFPGQEQQVIDYFRKNQQAVANLRAPIYEDKVVAHVLDEAKTEEKVVTLEEFNKLAEELNTVP